jgi:2-succinyl-5-enolpyruvyl-6-hydroxy-3-cyclohexene-1-carboxylate synthase
MTKYYSDEKNAQIVIALLKAHDIRKVIASPGATNIPITGSIQNDPFFEVYSSVDERSAAYIACGMAHESGEPIVLSCTGATASRNYLPGLTEAWYRKLPIIAITSTPSIVAVGHLIAQTIDRSVIPRDVARISVTLPHVKDAEDFWDCEIKVNKAILEAKRAGGGPVHINLATSYLGTFNTQILPTVRMIRRCGYCDVFPTIDPSEKVAVFIGAHKPFSPAETESLSRFVQTHSAVVLCDQTSGYKGQGRILSALACMQQLHQKPHFAALKPDLIIHLGEVSGDYPTQGFLGASGARVWRLNEDGELRDRFRRLEYVFELREAEFFRRQSDNLRPHDNTYLVAWQEYTRRIASATPDLPFSNTWIAGELSRALPVNASLHFGILNSLRNWNLYEVEASIQTICNVGGFGIDGCVSTLIGASLANKDKLHFGVIGDLSFFYDLNSIGNRHLGSNVRLLLINNGGGVEFELKSHIGAQFAEQTADFIAAGGHFGNKSRALVKHIAEDLGFQYLSANDKDEFRRVVQQFTTATALSQPILFECFTTSAEENSALEIMERLDTTADLKPAANSAGGSAITQGLKGAMKLASKVLPPGVKDSIKKALR